MATEVKSLASQTARATEDIAQQIGCVQKATSDAVKAIEGITGTILRINAIAGGISTAVREQGEATQGIARNVQEASRGVHEVSQNIGGVTQASGETGSASSRVLASARELAEQSEHLRSEVDRFIAQVRA